MAKYDPIIVELEQELSDLVKLGHLLIMRRVRVMEYPLGGDPVDVTQKYADGLRTAADALTKAVAALKLPG